MAPQPARRVLGRPTAPNGLSGHGSHLKPPEHHSHVSISSSLASSDGSSVYNGVGVPVNGARADAGAAAGAEAGSRDGGAYGGTPASFDDAAHSPAQIVCPICQESMRSLRQLNRHLDDAHTELAEQVHRQGVRQWFNRQISRNATVQAVSRAMGLAEDFERNGSTAATDADGAAADGTCTQNVGIDAAKETDDLVSRSHWQRESGDERCSLSSCGKRLKFRSRPVHCRHCGRIYCDEHTMHQMKLSRSATYEPVRGIWCRVCITCYEARPWYRDATGASNDLTTSFKGMRQRRLATHQLQSNRLETRLNRLLSGIASQEAGGDDAADTASTDDRSPRENAFSSVTSLFSTLSMPTKAGTAAGRRKRFEQSVVAWEDDRDIKACPFCDRAFGYATNRRHHCRLCGKVRCGDPGTQCSRLVPFTVRVPRRADDGRPTDKPTADGTVPVHIDLRLCKECSQTVFGRSEQRALVDEKSRPDFLRLHEALRELERGIAPLVPRFQQLLLQLDGDPTANTSAAGSAGSDTPEGSINGDRPAQAGHASPRPAVNGGYFVNRHSTPSPVPGDAAALRPQQTLGGGSSVGVTKADIQEAARVRKRLIDALAQYDRTSKLLAPHFALMGNTTSDRPAATPAPSDSSGGGGGGLPSGSDGAAPSLAAENPAVLAAWRAANAAERRVRLGMARRARDWLQAHTLPLKSVPKVMSRRERDHRQALAQAHSNSPSAASDDQSAGATAPGSTGAGSGGAAGVGAGAGPAGADRLRDDHNLRETWVAFREQEYLLSAQYDGFVKARNFDDAAAVRRGLEELRKEIARLEEELGA